jgi:hypothetical protein
MVMLVVRHGVEPDPARQYQTSDIAIMPILEIICATQQFNLGRYVMEFEYSGIPARTGAPGRRHLLRHRNRFRVRRSILSA